MAEVRGSIPRSPTTDSKGLSCPLAAASFGLGTPLAPLLASHLTFNTRDDLDRRRWSPLGGLACQREIEVADRHNARLDLAVPVRGRDLAVAEQRLEEVGVVLDLHRHQGRIGVTKTVEHELAVGCVDPGNAGALQRSIEIACRVVRGGEDERVRARGPGNLFLEQMEHILRNGDGGPAARALSQAAFGLAQMDDAGLKVDLRFEQGLVRRTGRRGEFGRTSTRDKERSIERAPVLRYVVEDQDEFVAREGSDFRFAPRLGAGFGHVNPVFSQQAEQAGEILVDRGPRNDLEPVSLMATNCSPAAKSKAISFVNLTGRHQALKRLCIAESQREVRPRRIWHLR